MAARVVAPAFRLFRLVPETFPGRSVYERHQSVPVAGEEQAGFLEALACRCHEVAEAARVDPEQPTRLTIVERRRQVRDVRIPIRAIHGASREDVGAAAERGVRPPAHHEHLQAGAYRVSRPGARAQDDDRGRVAHLGLGHLVQRTGLARHGPDVDALDWTVRRSRPPVCR